MSSPAPQTKRTPEPRHLRYLLALAAERHFGRAAARCGIAQPPFSQQIQQLEQLVGLTLVRRRPEIGLTAAGEQLAATARTLFNQLDDGLERTRLIGAGYAGKLRIASASSTLLSAFPSALRRFHQNHPQIGIQLVELPSAAQAAALRAGEIDVGVSREPVNDLDLLVEPFATEGFLAAFPEDHPFARVDQPLKLSDLRDERFVMFPSHVAPALHAQVEKLFQRASYTPRVVMEADEWITVISLVEAGLGIAIAPESFRRLRLGKVRYLPIDDNLHTTIGFCLSRHHHSPIGSLFLETVRQSTIDSIN